MTRIVRSLWITRKSIDGGFHPPELLQAWDEWSIDEYPEGWLEACEKALAAVGSDVASVRYVDLRLSGETLAQAFEPVSVEALVSETGGAE